MRMYVEFSAPMERKSGVEYITLLDHAGKEIPGAVLPLEYEFWSPARSISWRRDGRSRPGNDVFEVAVANRAGRITERKRLTRRQFEPWIDALPAGTTVVMEACSMAHYWGRRCVAHGRAVRLLPPQYVRPYVRFTLCRVSRRSQSRLSEAPCGEGSRTAVGTDARRDTCCGSEPCERRVARDRRETASGGPSPAQVTDSHGPAPAATRTRSSGFPRGRAVRRAACVRPLVWECGDQK
jgi:hypothetical protein